MLQKTQTADMQQEMVIDCEHTIQVVEKKKKKGEMLQEMLQKTARVYGYYSPIMWAS